MTTEKEHQEFNESMELCLEKTVRLIDKHFDTLEGLLERDEFSMEKSRYPDAILFLTAVDKETFQAVSIIVGTIEDAFRGMIHNAIRVGYALALDDMPPQMDVLTQVLDGLERRREEMRKSLEDLDASS